MLDAQIGEWRAYVVRHAALGTADVDELEAHLRDQTDDLTALGLSEDEAFLVAVKRLGSIDAISREFAREHSDRLWKQLVLTGEPDGTATRDGLVVAIVLAVASAVAVKVPAVFGIGPGDDGGDFFGRSIALFTLPFLALYFGWRRRMRPGAFVSLVAAPMLVIAIALNVYPFAYTDQTFILAAIYAPVALWSVVGIAYAAGEWRSHVARMDFIRFTGEWVVYYVLIALGGGVLAGLSLAAFSVVGIQAEDVIVEWVVVGGAMGAVVIAAWLVEAKQSVVENIAPVLTRVFTPLTAIMLVALLVATVLGGSLGDVDRDMLIVVDLVLVLVFGLVLYAISARDGLAPPDWFDRMQLGLLVVAVVVDALMLATMLTRIADGGLTANKASALGLNLVLLVNLAWAAWLSWGFVSRRRPFADVERWQTAYLPVFAVWAAVVVIAFPPLFGFR